MLLIFVSVLLFLALSFGLGELSRRLMGLEAARNPFTLCWFGLFVCCLLLAPFSLFFPLNSLSALLFALPCLAGLFLFLHKRQPGPDKPTRRSKRYFLLFGVFIVAMIAMAAAYAEWNPPRQFDTGMYHSSIVRWLNTYGINQGLGNLHHRLANNYAWLDLAALMDNGPWDARSAWILPAFLASLTLLYFFYEICFSSQNFARYFSFAMLPCIFMIPWIFRPKLDSDNTALVLHCVVLLEMLHVWLGPSGNTVKKLIIPLGLLAFGFMVKALAPAGVIIGSLFALLLLRDRKECSLSSAGRVFALPALAALFWLGRNVLLSGYPFFPITIMPFPVDWLMEASIVQENAYLVRGAGRSLDKLHEAMAGGISYWVPLWLDEQLHNRASLKLIFAPFLLAIPLWLAVLRKQRDALTLCLFCWLTVCIAAWFYTSPNPRFGYTFPWAFMACGVGLLAHIYKIQLKQLTLCAAALLLILLVPHAFKELRKGEHLALVPGLLPSDLASPVNMEGNGHPFTLYLGKESLCANAPLPCVPALPPQPVCLRDPENMGKGFRLCAATRP